MSSRTVSEPKKTKMAGELGHVATVEYDDGINMVLAVAYTEEGATKIAAVLTKEKGWIPPEEPTEQGTFPFTNISNSGEAFRAAKLDAVRVVMERLDP
jgi:hypothetical protein